MTDRQVLQKLLAVIQEELKPKKTKEPTIEALCKAILYSDPEADPRKHRVTSRVDRKAMAMSFLRDKTKWNMTWSQLSLNQQGMLTRLKNAHIDSMVELWENVRGIET